MPTAPEFVRHWLAAQPIDATQALNLSAGGSKCKVFRGHLLNSLALRNGYDVRPKSQCRWRRSSNRRPAVTRARFQMLQIRLVMREGERRLYRQYCSRLVFALVVGAGCLIAASTDCAAEVGGGPLPLKQFPAAQVFTFLFLMLGPFKIIGPFAKVTKGADARLTRQIAVWATIFSNSCTPDCRRPRRELPEQIRHSATRACAVCRDHSLFGGAHEFARSVRAV